ncbi:hypothetical protein PTSG_08161 [Salpingoeca rosetta]|uniref:Structural maintenance of chromosomes protein 5 n=1 Tax=Salpingoeca rosetta (strain ATCC 50818 / BSB-021) TaxID=946362 RepID=F2UI64_SALR5|nr:uncharacterized protein PTSG_08161 [Salpingoeca rosetta]EGD76813.1 hypothetical protein PTSG_08161 [Salpingoeca rosetta]|eukprot:XP_004991185.1 hypothetical protein PTSG_08161 [Salpingoeca rosetta]
MAPTSRRRRHKEEAEVDDDGEFDDEVAEEQETANGDGPPAAKKSKTTSPSLYRDGAIVRMKLENFVTYNHVEFRPGPSLNVVIGPNGTGKSSIVCAMALALAGKPSVLGRETKAAAFIRTGANSATIEVELFQSSGQNMVVRRVIKKGNQNAFYINGKPTTEQNVRETVAKQGIQIDNLCQFLPQDKVSAFAKKTPQELLVDTQRAKQLQPFRKAVEKAEKDKAQKEKNLSGVKPNIGKLQRRLNKLQTQAADFSSSILTTLPPSPPAVITTITTVTTAATTLIRGMNCERKIAELTARLSGQRDMQQIQADLREMRHRENEFTPQLDAIRDETQDLQASIQGRTRAIQKHKNAIQEAENAQKRKQAALEQRNGWMRDAIAWINDMNKFRMRVFPPLVLNINVQQSDVAALVEHSIPGRDRIAFLCQCEDDQRMLVSTLRKQRGFPINVVRIPPDDLSSISAPLTPEEAQHFGIDGFLLDAVDAPDRVKVYLAKVLYLHQTPYVRRKSRDIADGLKERGFKSFFIGTTGYRVMSSRFDRRADAMRLDEVKPAQLLALSVDTDRRQHLIGEIRRLEEEIETSQQQLQQLEARAAEIEEEKSQFSQRIAALQEERHKVVDLSGKIKRYETSREAYNNQLHQLQVKKEVVQKEMADLIASSGSYWREIEDTAQKLVGKMDVLTVLQLNLDRAEATVHVNTRAPEEEEDSLRAHAHVVKQLKDDAARANNDNSMLTEEQKQEFAGLAKTIPGLEAAKADLQAQMHVIAPANASAVDAFESALKRLEQHKGELREVQEKLKGFNAEMAAVAKQWKAELKKLNYEDWGIEISVSFRKDEALQPLRAHHQSGGERSVSTMLYLMSLQRLTRCPFRVVDEINQGMDATNEKRVFEQVVNSSTSESSQYFLITPKLLPDLPYNPAMTVLCVYNGPHMLTHSKWNLPSFLSARRRLALSA